LAEKKGLKVPLAAAVDWPADKVERWPLDRLIPYAQNARTHSDEQVEQIAASIREFGFTNPVLIDDAGGIIAGHGRVLAARKLGIAEVPVMAAIGWSETQKRAYVIADNKLTENAGWDSTLLASEIGSLSAEDFDVSLTGFSPDEIDGLLSGGSLAVVREMQTSEVSDRFWISLRGPLAHQAKALDAVKAAMGEVHGIEVDIGVISL